MEIPSIHDDSSKLKQDVPDLLFEETANTNYKGFPKSSKQRPLYSVYQNRKNPCVLPLALLWLFNCLYKNLDMYLPNQSACLLSITIPMPYPCLF